MRPGPIQTGATLGMPLPGSSQPTPGSLPSSHSAHSAHSLWGAHGAQAHSISPATQGSSTSASPAFLSPAPGGVYQLGGGAGAQHLGQEHAAVTSQLQTLEAAKQAAVGSEDYPRAMSLKQERLNALNALENRRPR